MYHFNNPFIWQNFFYFPVCNRQTLQNNQYTETAPSFSPLQYSLSPVPQAQVKVEENIIQEEIQNNTTSNIEFKETLNVQKRDFKTKNDQEYRPEESESKKSRKSRQDENRNVIPNTIHQLLSFIQRKQRSQQYVKKVFEKFKHPQQCTVKKFYLYQKKLKDNVNNYVNEDTLKLLNYLHQPQCSVYSEQEQRYYLKVCRVAIHQFMNDQTALIVLTSKRMNKNKKKEHLKAKKVIESKLAKIYGGQQL